MAERGEDSLVREGGGHGEEKDLTEELTDERNSKVYAVI